jgi:hypothetical protein
LKDIEMAEVGLFGRGRPRGFLCLGGREKQIRKRAKRAFVGRKKRDPSRGSLGSFGDEKMSPQDDNFFPCVASG